MTSIGPSTKRLLILVISLLGGFIAKAETPPPSLQSYPKAQRLWIGIDEATVESAKQKSFRTNNEDRISVLKAHGSVLKEGDHWATIGAENLEFDRRSLQIAEQKFQSDIEALTVKQEAFIDKVKSSRLILKTQKLDLESILKSETLSSAIQNRIRSNLKTLNTKDLELKASMSKEKLLKKFHFAEEKLQLELEKTRQSFMLHERRSTLKAPFDGVLKYTLEDPERLHLETEDIWLDSNQTFASINDDSHYELKISNRNPVFLTSQLKNLSLSAEVGYNNQYLNANYLSTRHLEHRGSRMTDQHIFKVNEKSTSFAKSNVGETLPVYVYRNFKKPLIIIEKNKVALLNPEVLESRGWVGLILHLYPNTAVSAVGPEAIAVSLRHEN